MIKDIEFFKILDNDITEKDLLKIEELEKMKYKQDKQIVRLKQKPLEFYFADIKNIKLRNQRIKEAVFDGYKQSEIADFLDLSRTTISKAMKVENLKVECKRA
jgi:DNA-binding NarL/FixJ family response regulator